VVPGLLAFVVRNGGILSSKIRRQICDEAKGTSNEFIASSVFYNFPDSKHWTSSIRLTKSLTEEQSFALNNSLKLQHNDAIFVAQKPEIFTVLPL
jgi:hypothetical protein